jgi:hypothetical protein
MCELCTCFVRVVYLTVGMETESGSGGGPDVGSFFADRLAAVFSACCRSFSARVNGCPDGVD